MSDPWSKIQARAEKAERDCDEMRANWETERERAALAERELETQDRAHSVVYADILDQLHEARRERDEAVRLLEVCPVGQGAVPGQFVVRATGGFFMPSLAEWEKERRAFLARHKENSSESDR